MRNKIIKSRFLSVVSATVVLAAGMEAQTLQEKLQKQYALTTATADNTEIVTAGCVITFKKRGLTASAVTSGAPATNSFKNKDPQIRPSAMSTLRRGFGIPGIPTVPNSNTRVFVNGEKMFVTRFDVDMNKDTVTFGLISDAINDVRYHAILRFEFPKGSLATADVAQVQPVLDEAISVTPPDTSAGAQQPGAAPQGAAPAPAPPPPAVTEAAPPPMAPIPPPPPPPADPAPPASIALGQTTAQVVASMGQPLKIVKLAAGKEVYYYKDMKVTFVNGKMTDAQ